MRPCWRLWGGCWLLGLGGEGGGEVVVLVGSSWLLFVCTRCVWEEGGLVPFYVFICLHYMKKFISSLLVPPWP